MTKVRFDPDLHPGRNVNELAAKLGVSPDHIKAWSGEENLYVDDIGEFTIPRTVSSEIVDNYRENERARFEAERQDREAREERHAAVLALYRERLAEAQVGVTRSRRGLRFLAPGRMAEAEIGESTGSVLTEAEKQKLWAEAEREVDRGQ